MTLSNPTSKPAVSDASKTIAVTGSTGFVGQQIVDKLVKSGYRVRALVRATSKAREKFSTEALQNGSIVLKKGTLDDQSSLDALLEGCSACIHLVGIIRETSPIQSFEQVHVQGTRAIVDACIRRDPALRYIHMSALGIGPSTRAGYSDTKFRAEKIVQNSSLGWTIIKPGLIHGPKGEFTQIAADWARGKRAPFVFLPYFSRWKRGGFGFESPTVAPVFVNDVANAFVESISHDNAIGQVYPISGSEDIAFSDMLRMYGEMITPKPIRRPAIGIPWRLAALQARIAALVGAGKYLPFDEGMAIMGGRDSIADNTKIQTDLGIEVRGFQETLRQYADQL